MRESRFQYLESQLYQRVIEGVNGAIGVGCAHWDNGAGTGDIRRKMKNASLREQEGVRNNRMEREVRV